MTNHLFFLSVSIASTAFQRLRYACWHLKTILAAYGCPLRVGTFRGRHDTQTSKHRQHLRPYQNSVAEATRAPQI